jgi:hypothetical protein
MWASRPTRGKSNFADNFSAVENMHIIFPTVGEKQKFIDNNSHFLLYKMKYISQYPLTPIGLISYGCLFCVLLPKIKKEPLFTKIVFTKREK